MIDHVLIYVKDVTKSREFYEKALRPLSAKISFGKEGIFWSFDVGSGALFEITQYQGTTPITPSHVAFSAKNQEEVEQFYNAALAAGGICNGKPGYRPQYKENYYAAFVRDPSGHNIEAVFDPKTLPFHF